LIEHLDFENPFLYTAQGRTENSVVRSEDGWARAKHKFRRQVDGLACLQLQNGYPASYELTNVAFLKIRC
jgi:hypothetical protein